MIEFNGKKDLVSIIAPASSCTDADIKLRQAINLLKSHGLKSTVDDRIFIGDNVSFFAAPKAIRLEMFKQAIANPAVKIIWGFRGGYGCSEIIFDCLDIKPSTPKILIGYSDLTAMHILFNQRYKMPTIHGSVLTSLVSGKQNIEPIIDVLSGKDMKIELMPLNDVALHIDKINGKVMGGNLTIICNMLGTQLQPALNGKILIIEDTNEKGYHIHRHLIHMKNAGVLANLAAIIFGDFTDSDENLEPAIDHFCQNYLQNIPAYRASGIGHSNINHPIVLGGMATIIENKITIKSPFTLV